VITVRLDKHKHLRKRFDCGVEACMMANQQSRKDNSRTFVLEDDSNPTHIIGFYTLTMAPIDLSALPPSLQKLFITVADVRLNMA